MSIKIDFQPRPDHVHAVVTGTFDHDQLPQSLGVIFAASAKNRLPKILVDITNLQGEISLLARYDFGHVAAQLQQEPVRLAVVGTNDQVWADRFGENVANNRGVRTKVTTDLAEALAWLHGDDAHLPRK